MCGSREHMGPCDKLGTQQVSSQGHRSACLGLGRSQKLLPLTRCFSSWAGGSAGRPFGTGVAGPGCRALLDPTRSRLWLVGTQPYPQAHSPGRGRLRSHMCPGADRHGLAVTLSPKVTHTAEIATSQAP